MKRQKQRMRVWIMALAAVLLTAVTACENAAGGGTAAGVDSSLVGTWKTSVPVSATQNADMQFTFNANGSCSIISFVESGSMSESAQINGTWRADGAKLYIQITQPSAGLVGGTLSFSTITDKLKPISDTTWEGSLNGMEEGLSGDAVLRVTGTSFTLTVNINFNGILSGTATLSGTRNGDDLVVKDSKVEAEVSFDYEITGSQLTLSVNGTDAEQIILTKQ